MERRREKEEQQLQREEERKHAVKGQVSQLKRREDELLKEIAIL